MKVKDLGSAYNVSVSEREIDDFNRRWPGSELRGLKGVTFQFEKQNGDLIDVWYKNGSSDRWDGSAGAALSQDAQEYGKQKLKLSNPGNGNKPILVVHASAENDRSGNPRRVFILLDSDADIVATIDEGYSGVGILRRGGYDKLPRFNIETTPSEYKQFIKLGKSLKSPNLKTKLLR